MQDFPLSASMEQHWLLQYQGRLMLRTIDAVLGASKCRNFGSKSPVTVLLKGALCAAQMLERYVKNVSIFC